MKPARKPAKVEAVVLTQPMPSDPGAQTTVLSCLLQQEELLDLPFSEDWLYPPRCQDAVIYQAMKQMRSEGRPVEYTALLGFLKDHGLLERAGGNGYLAELLVVAPTNNFNYYLQQLKDKHLERVVIEGGIQMIETAYSHDTKAMETVATDRLVALTEAIRGKREESMEEQLDQWVEEWHQMKKGEKPSSFPTRWPIWNMRCKGLRPGYTVISGPRGSGKSTLAQNLMTDACIVGGQAGLVVNYEMPVRMTINRIIADIGKIDGVHLFCPDQSNPSRDVERQITQCLQKIKQSKLRIVHDTSLRMEDVANMARALKSKHGSCKVMVDYVQLVDPPQMAKDGNREQEVAKNSSILRKLSKELDDAVIGLSQLNKDGTTRESASIESDADDVYRVERYKQQDGSTSEGGVLVFKARSGPEGFHLPLTLHGGYYRFVEKGSANDLP
jgi:replicative DNA helicase